VNSGASITGEAALFQAYQDWRRLSKLEGEGIRVGDWTLVADCQKRLSALQPVIIRLTNQAREEWSRAGADLAAKENNLRGIVSTLVELEMQNSALLTEAKKGTRAQLDQLDHARQNLKRVHRSYSSIGPSAWNSFS
jgi:hypothetical protein